MVGRQAGLAYERCIGPLFSLFLNGADCIESTTRRVENGIFALVAIEQGTVRYDASKCYREYCGSTGGCEPRSPCQ